MADNPDIPTENGANGAGEEIAGEGVPFMIGAQYIKDLSFENPRGIETLTAIQQNPDVSVDVSTNAHLARTLARLRQRLGRTLSVLVIANNAFNIFDCIYLSM